MGLTQLAWSSLAMPWVFTLFLSLMIGDNQRGWLSRFVAGCLLYGIVALFIALALSLTGLPGWVLVADLGGGFAAFLVFSILWKVARKRDPDSRLHKIVSWVVGITFAVLAAAAFIPVLKPLWDPAILSQMIISLLLCGVGLGAVVGLFYLIGRIEERYNL